MIKSLLYSLFLHFGLLLIIYANFNLKKNEETKTSEIAVSLVAISGDKNPNSMKVDEDKEQNEKKANAKTKADTLKEAESYKKSPRNKVKRQSKKFTKSKQTSTIAKSKSEEKIKEFKQEEKDESKQLEALKNKDDKPEEVVEDDKKIAEENSHKELDLGSKKEFNQEQEANNQKDVEQNQSANLVNDIESLDLSVREKFNIQSQLKRCYRRAIQENNLNTKFTVLIKVSISKEGYIDSDLEEMVDIDRYNDQKETGYKIAIDNVRRAIDLCSPLRNLPIDKYDVWKEVVLDFSQDETTQ